MFSQAANPYICLKKIEANLSSYPMHHRSLLLIFSAFALLFSACKEQSQTTGWNYNDPDFGGFEKSYPLEQEAGPNLVFIPGGTFTMGLKEQDMTFKMNSLPRQVSVTDFYMDETEVTNIAWQEYLFWLNRVFVDYPEVVRSALPDTNTWRRELAYNEPYVNYYLRHPAFYDYPVVGVSWEQATRYSEWRTDRVNEYILIREGYLEPNPDQVNEDNFNTDAYLAGQYEGVVGKQKKSYRPDQEGRRIRFEDGILLPDYRLPTEAEWEYAALALEGNAMFENINTSRIYPWDGLSLRKQEEERGEFRANFKRGGGDNQGISNMPNDAAEITSPVRSYWPNDFGLYNMSGNVNEWVADVYRPLSFEDVNGLNPYRGNVFKVTERDQDGYVAPKDSLGRIPKRNITEEEAAKTPNYDQADVRGAEDPMKFEGDDDSYQMGYAYGDATLINNEARIYKGGSWNDRAFWLNVGARRFLDQTRASSTIGFRCAMTAMGASPGNNPPVPGIDE